MADNPYSTVGASGPDTPDAPDDQGQPAPPPPGGPKAKDGASASPMTRSNVFLAVMFVGAGALVYGLTRSRVPAKASAQEKAMETEVDGAIMRIANDPKLAKSAPEAGRASRELLRTFADEIRQRQISASDLRKNPFEFVQPQLKVAASGPASADQTPSQPPPDPRQQTQDEARAKLANLNLQAIQHGQNGAAVAIISNNLVTEGQTIECFTVKRIGMKEVLLTWDGEDYVLKMP